MPFFGPRFIRPIQYIAVVLGEDLELDLYQDMYVDFGEGLDVEFLELSKKV